MAEKPPYADGYSPQQTVLVREACLYVATKLGDYLEDIVVAGGMVPSLLINQDNLPDGVESHVGTRDLDVGFSLGILKDERYRAISERLREAGFDRDTNDDGKLTRQRWKLEVVGKGKVTLDFLIPPTAEHAQGGTLQNIESDLAAIVAPGLSLAFQDCKYVTITGQTIKGEEASRDVPVCGPGAYVVLKALAFEGRGENKDAYDLAYVLRNYGAGIAEVHQRLAPLLSSPEAQQALRILRADFTSAQATGPKRIAQFLFKHDDANTQQDVAGAVKELLRLCER